MHYVHILILAGVVCVQTMSLSTWNPRKRRTLSLRLLFHLHLIPTISVASDIRSTATLHAA